MSEDGFTFHLRSNEEHYEKSHINPNVIYPCRKKGNEKTSGKNSCLSRKTEVVNCLVSASAQSLEEGEYDNGNVWDRTTLGSVVKDPATRRFVKKSV